MELLREDTLIQEFKRFLAFKESGPSESTYTEFHLFTNIQYLKILESQLEQCKTENAKALRQCETSSTKVVSKTYTILTSPYLKRRQEKVLEVLENIHQVITDYLNSASEYAGLIDTNCWFAWWEEYIGSLEEAELAYIADCRKQSQEPIIIQPHKSLEQFVLEQQRKSEEQSEPQKKYSA